MFGWYTDLRWTYKIKDDLEEHQYQKDHEDQEEHKWSTLKKLRELKNLAEEEILSLPVLARVCYTDQFNLEWFMNATFDPFVDAFIEEINEAFEQL